MRRVFKFLLRYTVSVASCLYLFTIGMLAAKNRKLLELICERTRIGSRLLPSPLIPSIDPKEVVSDESAIVLPNLTAIAGNAAVIELAVMAQLVRSRRPKRLFEIGTLDGRTTLVLAANADPDAVVYTLDLPAKDTSTKFAKASGEDFLVRPESRGARFKGTPESKKIVQLLGDSAAFDPGPALNACDFVYIDASHSYEYVLNDSRLAQRLLRNGKGIILWHDYITWDSVTQALHRLHREDPLFCSMRWIAGTSLVYSVQ